MLLLLCYNIKSKLQIFLPFVFNLLSLKYVIAGLLTWLLTHIAVPLNCSPTSQMHTAIWQMLLRKRVRWSKQRSATTLPCVFVLHMQILSTIWPTLNGSKDILRKQLVSISRPWRFSLSLQQHIQTWHPSFSSRASSMRPLCTIKKPSGKYLSCHCIIIFFVEWSQALIL